MTKLTVEQIQQIEERLYGKYNLKYDEIRNEILDHIACEIEELIQEGETFEDASILTFRKWNAKLISEKKGVYRGIPQFIVKQLDKEYKKVEFQSMLLSLVFCISWIVITYNLSINAILLMAFLLSINAVGVLVIHRKSKAFEDYRYDFFKQKSLMVMGKSILVFLFIIICNFMWGFDSSLFSLDWLTMYYFILNTYVLYQFNRYCKYQKFNIAK